MGIVRKVLISLHLVIILVSSFFVAQFLSGKKGAEYTGWFGWVVVYQAGINLILAILLCMFKRRWWWYDITFWTIEVAILSAFFDNQRKMTETFQCFFIPYQIIFMFFLVHCCSGIRKRYHQRQGGMILEEPTALKINGVPKCIYRIQPRFTTNDAFITFNGKRHRDKDLTIEFKGQTIYSRDMNMGNENYPDSYLTRLPWKPGADGLAPDPEMLV